MVHVGSSPASRLVVAVTAVVVLVSLTGCVADAAPIMGGATAGDGQATVSWSAPPLESGLTVSTYVVTPYIGTVAQTPRVFSSTPTTRTITGLTNGTTYTFQVYAININGDTASSASSNPVTPTGPVPVSAINFAFQPAALTVDIGVTVVWTNNSNSPHTVTADDGSFNSGSMAAGGTFTRTFSSAGAVPYYCSFHGTAGGVGMAGQVTVIGP